MEKQWNKKLIVNYVICQEYTGRKCVKYSMAANKCNPQNSMPIPVAARSAAAWLLESRVRIPLRALIFVSCVDMLCCPV
jgi:hypothetical protein